MSLKHKRSDVGNLSDDSDEEPMLTQKRQKDGQTIKGEGFSLMNFNQKCSDSYINHEVNPDNEELIKVEAIKAEYNKAEYVETADKNSSKSSFASKLMVTQKSVKSI